MITSTANPHVKHIRSLSADRRARHRERSFVLEGVRLVAEALDAGASLHLVLYTPEQLAESQAGRHLLPRLAALPGSYEASARVVAAAADTVSPQGVVAVAAWPTPAAQPGPLLVLDSIQDPGNVGTLLRSAEAAGVGHVLCSRGTADVYSPKVVRSAMGAHFSLPLQADATWQEIAAALQAAPHIYAATGRADTAYYAVEWQQRSVLIIGNEAQGVSSEGLALATRQIAIPMQGRAESLNAAVAGSIILFEALRQRSSL